MSPRSAVGRQRGSSAAEFLLAAPLILLIGLGVWQWGLILQARQIAELGVREAVRSGSVGQAEVEAIKEGLAYGLAPLWVDADSLKDRSLTVRMSRSVLDSAELHGWLAWRQLSPTRESFLDWGVVTASDSLGAAAKVIPADNVRWRLRYAQPASGVSGLAGSEPIGATSGQTFREAGVLRIELTVGVPLHVPLAGRFISWAAGYAAGCQAGQSPGAGPIRLSKGSDLQASAQAAAPSTAPSRCHFYSSPDKSGVVQPRIPIKVIAEERMQSQARMTDRTPFKASVPGPVFSAGEFGAATGARDSTGTGPSTMSAMPEPADIRAEGDASRPAAGGHADPAGRPPGFLQIGGEREIWKPGACGIPAS
jgi:hypothetical protein